MASTDMGSLMFDEDAPPLTWVVSAFNTCSLFTGLALNVFCLGIIFMSRQHLLQYVSVQLLLPSIVAEAIKNGSIAFGMVFLTLASGTGARVASCQFLGFSIIFGYGVCIIAQADIAMNRYLVVVKGKKYSYWHTAAAVGAAAAIAFPVAISYVVLGNQYAPSASRTYCVPPWTSRDSRHIALNVACLTMISLAVNATLICQGIVFMAHRRAQRDLRSAQNFAKSWSCRETKEHKALMVQFFGLSAVMILGWAPVFGEILNSIATGVAVSPLADGIASILTSVSCIPVALIHLLFTPALTAETARRIRSVRVRLWPDAKASSTQLVMSAQNSFRAPNPKIQSA